MRRAVVDEVVVFVGDALVHKLLFDEVHKWHGRVVGHAHHRRTSLAIAAPIGIVGHFRRFHHSHGVEGRARGKAAHALAFTGRRTLHARQAVQLHRVVDHAAEEQQLLLRCRQLLITSDAPGVVAIEPLEGCVVGHEERLRTRLAQHFSITQIVDQANSVLIVALFRQPTVDARTPSFGSALIQIILTARTQNPRADQHRSGGSQHPKSQTSAGMSSGFHSLTVFVHIFVFGYFGFLRQLCFHGAKLHKKYARDILICSHCFAFR